MKTLKAKVANSICGEIETIHLLAQPCEASLRLKTFYYSNPSVAQKAHNVLHGILLHLQTVSHFVERF